MIGIGGNYRPPAIVHKAGNTTRGFFMSMFGRYPLAALGAAGLTLFLGGQLVAQSPAALIDEASTSVLDASASIDGVATPIATSTTASVQGEPAMDHLTVQQWVKLSDDGVLRGRVISSENGDNVGLANVEITLLSPDSEMLTATTGDDGRFEVESVPSGIYAMTGRADGYFACCAMHVVAPDMPAADQASSEATVTAAAVDFSDIQTAMIRYLPPVFDPIDHSVREADLKQLHPHIVADDMFKVRQRRGGLDGFIMRAGAVQATLMGAEQTNVFLFHNGEEVARTFTEPNGHFRIDDLQPGDYSLIAVGPKGVGTVGFELMDATEPETVSVHGADGTSLVQAGSYSSNSFAMQVAPPTETVGAMQGNVVSDVLIGEQVVGETVLGGCSTCAAQSGFAPVGGLTGGACGACGGAGGGFAGGGFAGGGLGGGGGLLGGGIGRLAALGGIGAAIAVAASDDDDDVQVPGAASPDTPTSDDNDAQGDDDDDDGDDDAQN